MSKKSFVQYFNRFKIMKPEDIGGRIKEKEIQLKEKRNFANKNKLIISKDLYKVENDRFYGIYVRQFNTKDMDLYTLELFNHYRINLKKKIPWHSAFSNMKELNWPMEFSYKLDYKQKNSFGCVKINWELNRQEFLPAIAMHYINTHDIEALIHLKRIFYDWVKSNPFLMGISWTSAEEVAVRTISWIITATIIKDDIKSEKLYLDLAAACRNQLEYIKLHHLGHYPEGNHLLVEMAALGFGAVAFRDKELLEPAIYAMNMELEKQTSQDGINKQQSLHHHAYVMELTALLVLQLKKYNLSYPNSMDDILDKMSLFLSSVMDENNAVPNLGDNDEGKIINLCNKEFNYYQYVLQFTSLLYKKTYIKLEELNRNLQLFFSSSDVESVICKPMENSTICYKDGGITILKYKSEEAERIMTFDHGPLGFGNAAAHGHSDALSITLSLDGEKFLIDPGTYLYYGDIAWRNYFRRTINHNTIAIDDTEQSEMLGAFQWGKKADTALREFISGEKEDFVAAEHYGYKPATHSRAITYKKPDLFIIKDVIYGDFVNCIESFVVDPDIKIITSHNLAELYGEKNVVYLYCSERINVEREYESEMYTKKKNTSVIRCSVNNKGSETEITTVMSINKKISDEVLRRYYNNNKEEVQY